MRSLFLSLLFLTGTQLYADIYAYKVGLLAHSQGPISSGKEEGYDLNLEVLWDEAFWSAHPSVGADINNQGFTSFLYTGVAWEDTFFDTIVWELFLGFAVHDGELTTDAADRRALGSRFLFREGIALGVDLGDNLTLSVLYAHYSHVGIDHRINQGSDNTGLRLAYYF